MSFESALSPLKTRIKQHYDTCSTYYESLWGTHIHHGYFLTPDDTKEQAQRQLIELLLERASIPTKTSPTFPHTTSDRVRVLDVGCGIGGTTRYLAKERGWDVEGVTISDTQVKMAYNISIKESSETDPHNLTSSTSTTHPTSSTSSTTSTPAPTTPTTPSLTPPSELDLTSLTLSDSPLPTHTLPFPPGTVQYHHLDAELISPHFPSSTYTLIWISEALSHLPQKHLFFKNAYALLKPGGRLVIADWVKAPVLSEVEEKADIEPIERGMLLPPLGTMGGYEGWAREVGFEQVGQGLDISEQVKKTWDISLSLVSSPSLWALAISMGTDFIEFLRAFQAMRRGFANKTFRYCVLVFEKPAYDDLD